MPPCKRMKVADKDLTPQGQIRQVMHGVADRTETGLTKKDILVEKVKQPDGSVKLLYKRKGKSKVAKERYTSKSTPSAFKAWSDITQQVWKEMGTPDMKRVNDVVKKGTPTYKEIKRRHEEWKKKHGAGGTRQNTKSKYRSIKLDVLEKPKPKVHRQLTKKTGIKADNNDRPTNPHGIGK